MMRILKDQIKDINNLKTKWVGFFAFILVVFVCSCSSEEEPVVIPTNEPDEPEETELTAPMIQTPAPLIHLAYNLDEQDQLGWCIDTRGIGFNEALHTHSCKPDGGDVQFFYSEETRQICSVDYTGFCMEMSGGAVAGMSLTLVESNSESPNQKFIYDADSGEFRPEEDMTLCLAAGATSAPAGNFMSRSLTLEPSADTDESLKKWVIVEN